ncbi:MAG: 2-phosphosulfolactate phosphatase [Bellilinea sp.]
MEIQRATNATCAMATDLVVAIDVLRAFTTSAYLFSMGVAEIFLVSGVQEAFSLREVMPDCLILGEVDGIKVPGFDLGNSPSRVVVNQVTGRRVIQRTTAGTQGVILAANAKTILTAGLINVSATAQYIRQLSPKNVTLIQTGFFPEEGWGEEDVACADMIENILLRRPVDLANITKRVRLSHSGLHFDGTRSDFPPNDLEMALKVDCFDFAMVVEHKNNLHVMRCEKI